MTDFVVDVREFPLHIVMVNLDRRLALLSDGTTIPVKFFDDDGRPCDGDDATTFTCKLGDITVSGNVEYASTITYH